MKLDTYLYVYMHIHMYAFTYILIKCICVYMFTYRLSEKEPLDFWKLPGETWLWVPQAPKAQSYFLQDQTGLLSQNSYTNLNMYIHIYVYVIYFYM